MCPQLVDLLPYLSDFIHMCSLVRHVLLAQLLPLVNLGIHLNDLRLELLDLPAQVEPQNGLFGGRLAR